LSSSQRADLRAIARDTWRFYAVDVNPHTALPMDNVTYAGGATTPTGYGRYTSASNIGVYLWAVVAAYDLELIGRRRPALASRPRSVRWRNCAGTTGSYSSGTTPRLVT
jgi:hypothetical protein